MKKVLEVRNLVRSGILNDVSFDVKKGELLAIMGPSGSGKSTLLYHVSGLEHIEGGQVVLGGESIGEMTEDDLADFRLTKTGFVFQQMNMMASLDILDNILLPAYHACHTKMEKRQKKERALALMKKMQIDSLAHREISKVSGGQLQRACICRSLINDPEILFADEPTGALSRSNAMDIMAELLRLSDEGTTILMVTHDSKVASFCDRVLYLLDGSIKGELAFSGSERQSEKEVQIVSWLQQLGW
jgi:putative ABC transport system ATP-binding protein